jgi:hypothetical protein
MGITPVYLHRMRPKLRVHALRSWVHKSIANSSTKPDDLIWSVTCWMAAFHMAAGTPQACATLAELENRVSNAQLCDELLEGCAASCTLASFAMTYE